MSTFLSIRNYVYFRHLFDAVHPLFWPVLYWQLKAARLSLQREKLTSVMLAVTWWGGVRIVYRGDKIETPSHDPPRTPLRPRFDDPVWSTRLPPVSTQSPHRGSFQSSPFSRGRCHRR
jgi:hypothetical protein